MFEIKNYEGYTLIKVLVDRLDVHNSIEFKSQIITITNNHIIMDLSECKYCDSCGLSVILIVYRKCKGGIFVLTGLTDFMTRLMTVSQLNSILNITSTVDEAKLKMKHLAN